MGTTTTTTKDDVYVPWGNAITAGGLYTLNSTTGSSRNGLVAAVSSLELAFALGAVKVCVESRLVGSGSFGVDIFGQGDQVSSVVRSRSSQGQAPPFGELRGLARPGLS